MPATLTLNNIPDNLYERLVLSAKSHRRSISDEAIVCLEIALSHTNLAPVEPLARARELRASLRRQTYHPNDIAAFKRPGAS